MLRRLAKLGIDKTNPDDLTPEERSKFVRCGHVLTLGPPCSALPAAVVCMKPTRKAQRMYAIAETELAPGRPI
jgi:hypothetical protein